MASTINGVTTKFVGEYYEVSGTDVTKYYGGKTAMRINGTLTYLLPDHLGSNSLVVDSSGNMLSETMHKAWGELRYTTGTTTTPYTYTGQYSNTGDFGWMYYKARWYDSALGRFSQADSIVPGAGDPRAWDRYAYVKNNPVRYNDPTGHDQSCHSDLECAKLYGLLNPNQTEVSTIVQTQSQYTDYIMVTLRLGYNGCGVVAASYVGAELKTLADAVLAHNFLSEGNLNYPGGIQPAQYTQALKDVYGERVNEYRRTDPIRLLRDLFYEMQLGNFAIVDFVPPGVIYAHFALVTGINFKTGLITLDNTTGGKSWTMTINDFISSWYDPEQKASPKPYAEKLDYWAVVIGWRKINSKLSIMQ